jgi:hypothetical protein
MNGGYRLTGELELKTKFWGKSIQLLLQGHSQLALPGTGDHFLWNRPPMSVNDIILGELCGSARWAPAGPRGVLRLLCTQSFARLARVARHLPGRCQPLAAPGGSRQSPPPG